jgi:uncharacterized protein YbaR (Trm112 family)
MNVELSDLLTCPRCGPTYGLVLLPHEMADRRVRAGVLGCANCRERWQIEGGVADLRVDVEFEAEGEGAGEGEGGGEGEGVVRLAGLMGLAEAQGTVLVAGPGSVHAAALSELVEGVEVVAAGDRGRAVAAGPGVSPVRVTEVLPLRSGSLRGVALTGSRVSLLEEGARVLGSAGRLVVDPAPAGTRERLEAAGLEVVAEEGDVVVASRGD